MKFEIKHCHTKKTIVKGEAKTLKAFVEQNKANLRFADLRKADLRFADLRRASLFGADLTGASLFEASLYEADLREANLAGADLAGTALVMEPIKSPEIADVFVVDVYNEGGCVVAGLGDSHTNLEDALKEAKSITKSQAEEAGTYNRKDGTGVNVIITAGTKDSLDVACDGCTGAGLIIYDRLLLQF